MVIISVEFVAGRYHATPWDAHVNEGRVEWPPAPWRLLRALLAVGYSKLGWGHQPPPEAMLLMNALAERRPEFQLPIATAAHTRHYMPTREGRNEKTAKVFDAFLRFPDTAATMFVRYDISLNEEQRELLQQLVEGLAYLGRAESWTEASLVDEVPSDTGYATVEARPAAIGDSHRIRLLGSMPPESYPNWRSVQLEPATASAVATAEADVIAKAEKKGKTATPKAIQKARDKATDRVTEPYPPTLLDSLQLDSIQWQKFGWSRPPGSEWIDYHVPEHACRNEPLLTSQPNAPQEKPTCLLLAIDGEGKRGQLRPLRERALPLMELMHAEAVRHMSSLQLGHLPELTGQDENGNRRRDGHRHAHYIPLSLTSRRHIDHVLVYAPGGFSTEAIRTISNIRWAYAKGIRRLSVNLVGSGTVTSLFDQLRGNPAVRARAVDMLRPARRFETVTPLVLRMYLAKSGRKSLVGQIRDELQERGLPNVCDVQPFARQQTATKKLRGFVLRRQNGKRQPPREISWGVALTFDEPVCGPITLGYASHFGLGLFEAAD